MIRLLLLFGIFFCIYAPPARGQANDDVDERAQNVYIRIATNSPEALLVVDSTLIGAVPSGIVTVPAETKRIRLVHRDAHTWSVPPVETALRAVAGDTIDIELAFDYHYRVESIPFGADVLLEEGEERTLLGSTPLLHTSSEPLNGLLALERPGYAIERVEPGEQVWNRFVISLHPSENLDPAAAQVDWRPPRQRRQWIDYAALGTALAAGVFAVHYKFKADNLYEEYEATADPAIRADMNAYDVRSGVAFGVMQAGVGIFAIRLLIR